MVVKPILNLATKYTDDVIGFGVRKWTKPTNFEGLKYPRNLSKDVVQLEQKIPNRIFSSLESNIINEIKCGKIENARVIDKSGNLVKDIEFIGDKYGVRISPECLLKDGVLEKFVDATYIHNHPFNAPLSSNDIVVMALNKIKKMVACTSDGGYSIIERIKPISKMDYENFIRASFKLNSEEILQMKSLGKIRGITDMQRMELLNKWRYERFKSFSDEFGLTFQNNISTPNKQEHLTGNLFQVNYLQRLIDNIIIRCRKT